MQRLTILWSTTVSEPTSRVEARVHWKRVTDDACILLSGKEANASSLSAAGGENLPPVCLSSSSRPGHRLLTQLSSTRRSESCVRLLSQHQLLLQHTLSQDACPQFLDTRLKNIWVYGSLCLQSSEEKVIEGRESFESERRTTTTSGSTGSTAS